MRARPADAQQVGQSGNGQALAARPRTSATMNRSTTAPIADTTRLGQKRPRASILVRA